MLTSLIVFMLEVTLDDRSALRLFLYIVALVVSSLCFVGYLYLSLGYTIVDGTFFRPMMPILFAIVCISVVASHIDRSQTSVIAEQRRVINQLNEKLHRLDKRIE